MRFLALLPACLVGWLSCCWLTAAPLEDSGRQVEPRPSAPVAEQPSPRPAAAGRSVSEIIVGTIQEELADELPEAEFLPPAEEGEEDSSPSVKAMRAFSARDIDGCLSHLRDVVALRPTLPPPKLILAGFHLKAGQRTEARAILEEMAARSSKHPQLYISLADLALIEGRLADAESHLQLAAAQGIPSAWNEQEKQWLQVSILRHQAEIAERRQKWEKAAGLLGQWVQLAPQSAPLRQRWATALFHAGQSEEALEQFYIAYGQDPQLGAPEVAMGALLMGKAQYERANPWYARAIEKYPGDAAVLRAWAMALLYQDRAEEAQEQLARAVRLAGASVHTSVLRGIAARAEGKFDEAEEHLWRALEEAPRHEEAAYHLVLSLSAHEGEAKRLQAVEIAERLAAEMPRSSLAKAALGAAYLAQRDFAKAEPLLRGAALGAPIRPETIYLLGQALADAGQEDQARQVAAELAARIEQPGVFVMRPQAREWVKTLLR